MDKLEKVIKGFDVCKNLDGSCDGCPYFEEENAIGENDCMRGQLMIDALELLKEKQPKKGHWEKSKFSNDRWHKCSECGRLSERTDRNGFKLVCNYCRVCGADMREDGEQE